MQTIGVLANFARDISAKIRGISYVYCKVCGCEVTEKLSVLISQLTDFEVI
jgi:hypothetical protein